MVIWYICKCNELIKTWVKNISYVIHHTQSVHDVPKCMSCHKDIVVITARAHCFHDSIYIMLILQLWDLSTLCVVDPLWPFKYIYIYIYIYITKKQKAKLTKIYLKNEIWNLSTMKHSLEKDFIFHSDIYFSAGFALYFLVSDT